MCGEDEIFEAGRKIERELVSTLLTGCPLLEILATFREVLRISGEHTYDVPALQLSRAIRPEWSDVLLTVTHEAT